MSVCYTRALLDPGSTRTFCTEHLQRELDVKGKPLCIVINTISGEERVQTAEVQLDVKGAGMKWSRALRLREVIVKSEFPTRLNDTIPTMDEVKQWKHLQDIEFPKTLDHAIGVDLIVGLDVPEALQPLEVIAGRYGDPFAVRTRLGWTVNGPVGFPRPNAMAACSLMIGIQRTDDRRLYVQVKRFWELETEAEGDQHSEDIALSIDEKRVLKLWTDSIRMVAGHYQLPIPFRKDRPKFPDNRSMAQHRLAGLKRRLLRDTNLLQRYGAEMQKLLEKGYAEPVSPAELYSNADYTWYLPHHPVFQESKPEKVRIVFDCAAMHEYTSLNNNTLQGPDLTNKLLGILLRFRQGEVAIMADIEAMFHQIRVTPQHRDALRFLWWADGDLSRTTGVYRLTVHPFGGVWSPSCAAFALQRALKDQLNEFPEASRQAERNFYVDDLLLSVDTAPEASTVAQQLRVLLSRKGFRLTKWMSNSKEVIASIPTEERHAEVKEADLSLRDLPIERALGLRWDLHKDNLAIQVNQGSKPATKRGLLSIVSSVYDPMGFVSPYTIRAKMIFQDECRRTKEWDEPLAENSMRALETWKMELDKLAQFSIPRRYSHKLDNSQTSVQLHHFSDASQRAYGAASYLRFENDQGVHCSFVCGKARLAPLKQQTIPRLELCAAVLAAKLDLYLRQELDIPIERTVFWTDSTLVIQYIGNTEKRFRTFVANRVSIIRELSSSGQWRHVPTTENPADYATRGMTAEEIIQKNRWITGPQFLWERESEWPEKVVPHVEGGLDPEIITCSVTTNTGVPVVEISNKTLEKLWKHYSSWHRLQKVVTWIRKYVEWLKHNRPVPIGSTKLTVPEIKGARIAILRQAQKEHYKEEREALSRGTIITRRSSIYRLEPWIDENGLLRVGGRLLYNHTSPAKGGPVILPREHPITDLIIRDIHQNRAGHSGREHTLSLLRQHYWVPQCRRKLDAILSRCFVCRRNNWQLTHQRQAPLPEERVTPGAPPFSSTGVDCFGPFLVKQGRNHVKRWGCIFTCMASRAVHLEVLTSLDTDAFINALTRFSSRRGVPAKMRSDNGTNMIAADKELRTAVRSWSEDSSLQTTLLARQIEWTFNPPKASHMGGVWERQIRTVRKILRAIVGEQVLDDERLHTLLCETEAVINSRPITPASTDPRDLEALTPNHLLRVGACDSLPLGGSLNENQYRRRWKHVQFLADQFWKRWLREYLPLLRRRGGKLTTTRNLKKDDLVIITSEVMPRNQWKLGRIVHVQPGKDGIVRQVKVRTARQVLVRPVTKLCFLEGLGGP